jgi:hypothetical protein
VKTRARPTATTWPPICASTLAFALAAPCATAGDSGAAKLGLAGKASVALPVHLQTTQRGDDRVFYTIIGNLRQRGRMAVCPLASESTVRPDESRSFPPA